MIVFNTFLKVMKSCLATVILFTVILVIFGIFSFETNDTSMSFQASKPDVLIINNDEYRGITKSLIDYITDNSNIIKVNLEDEDAVNDAYFYRDVNYIIVIPEGFRKNFLDGLDVKLEVKSTGDYQASLANMMLERYMSTSKIYRDNFSDEEQIINGINKTLKIQSNVEMTSKLDAEGLSKMAFFYNFANYSILAGCVYVICLILSIFREKNINKRTVVSSMNYKKYNRHLLISNGLFVIVLWLFYVILSYFLVGDVVFSTHGIVCIINFFVFSIVSLSLAFFIGTLITDKNAVNGIVNVIALGSSFLCGAFVPMEFLPDAVIKLAHILPSYYYIENNNLISVMEEVSLSSLNSVIFNMVAMCLFIIIFVVLTNIISKRKQKQG